MDVLDVVDAPDFPVVPDFGHPLDIRDVRDINGNI